LAVVVVVVVVAVVVVGIVGVVVVPNQRELGLNTGEMPKFYIGREDVVVAL